MKLHHYHWYVKGQNFFTLHVKFEELYLEAGKEASAGEMVNQLASDFTLVCTELTEGIAIAEESKDQPTADMLIGIRDSLEKHSWMLEAFLGN